MGLLDWLFNRREQRRQEEPISVSVSMEYSRPEEDIKASELLKEATARHDRKDFDGATRCLRDAYAVMAGSSTTYPVATFLRLPLYLQKAGRYDEALLEFESLMRRCDHRDRVVVKDKMRLAAEREEKRLGKLLREAVR